MAARRRRALCLGGLGRTRPSGKTHFVNASTAFLLEQLLGEPASVESAAQALAQAQDRPVDDALRDDVAGTLLRLAELGLIESA